MFFSTFSSTSFGEIPQVANTCGNLFEISIASSDEDKL